MGNKGNMLEGNGQKFSQNLVSLAEHERKWARSNFLKFSSQHLSKKKIQNSLK